MTITADMQPENCEDDEIFDVVKELERSFDIHFDRNAFYAVKTFGDLCDVIQANIHHPQANGCTTQQAFYKIRTAICATLPVQADQVKPDSQLETLFPPKGRGRKIKTFERHLGLKTNMVSIPDWQVLVMLAGFIASLGLFYFNWQMALTGITCCVAAAVIANRFAKNLTLQTVRELTEKVVIEHYVAVRRNNGTVNRREILQTVQAAFSLRLGIDKKYLTENASFYW